MPMVGQVLVTSAYGGANELHVSMMYFFSFDLSRDLSFKLPKNEKFKPKIERC